MDLKFILADKHVAACSCLPSLAYYVMCNIPTHPQTTLLWRTAHREALGGLKGGDLSGLHSDGGGDFFAAVNVQGHRLGLPLAVRATRIDLLFLLDFSWNRLLVWREASNPQLFCFSSLSPLEHAAPIFIAICSLGSTLSIVF